MYNIKTSQKIWNLDIIRFVEMYRLNFLCLKGLSYINYFILFFWMFLKY